MQNGEHLPIEIITPVLQYRDGYTQAIECKLYILLTYIYIIYMNMAN